MLMYAINSVLSLSLSLSLFDINGSLGMECKSKNWGGGLSGMDRKQVVNVNCFYFRTALKVQKRF